MEYTYSRSALFALGKYRSIKCQVQNSVPKLRSTLYSVHRISIRLPVLANMVYYTCSIAMERSGSYRINGRWIKFPRFKDTPIGMRCITSTKLFALPMVPLQLHLISSDRPLLLKSWQMRKQSSRDGLNTSKPSWIAPLPWQGISLTEFLSIHWDLGWVIYHSIMKLKRQSSRWNPTHLPAPTTFHQREVQPYWPDVTMTHPENLGD